MVDLSRKKNKTTQSLVWVPVIEVPSLPAPLPSLTPTWLPLPSLALEGPSPAPDPIYPRPNKYGVSRSGTSLEEPLGVIWGQGQGPHSSPDGRLRCVSVSSWGIALHPLMASLGQPARAGEMLVQFTGLDGVSSRCPSSSRTSPHSEEAEKMKNTPGWLVGTYL